MFVFISQHRCHVTVQNLLHNFLIFAIFSMSGLQLLNTMTCTLYLKFHLYRIFISASIESLLTTFSILIMASLLEERDVNNLPTIHFCPCWASFTPSTTIQSFSSSASVSFLYPSTSVFAIFPTNRLLLKLSLRN